MLKTPSSYAKGSRVRLKGLGDCKNCEVALAEPLPCNEIILDFYGLLPNFDAWSGNKIFSVQDIKTLFEFFETPKSLWDEYYQKLIFFHKELLEAKNEIEKMEKKREDSIVPGQGLQKPRQPHKGAGLKNVRRKHK